MLDTLLIAIVAMGKARLAETRAKQSAPSRDE